MLSTTHYITDDTTKIEVSFDQASAGGWPVDIQLVTGHGTVLSKLIVSLTPRQSVALFAQFRDVLVEGKLVDSADLTPSGYVRQAELRDIADRLLGLSGADDDLVTEAEAEREAHDRTEREQAAGEYQYRESVAGDV